MTQAEIARAFAHNHREHEKFVTKELHDTVVEGLREDLREVKAAINKMLWAVVGMAFTLVGAIILEIAGRISP